MESREELSMGQCARDLGIKVSHQSEAAKIGLIELAQGGKTRDRRAFQTLKLAHNQKLRVARPQRAH